MTETITFFNIYESVLNTFSLTLLLGMFIIAIKYFHVPNRKWAIVAGLMFALLAMVHTYDIAIAGAVLIVYNLYHFLAHKKVVVMGNCLYVFLFGLVGVAWQSYVLHQNTALSIWANFQTNVPALPVIFYIYGFGMLLVLAVIGAGYAVFRRPDRYFLIVWLLIVPFLVYNPWFINLQRKFSEGYHIPIVILATTVIIYTVENLTNKKTIQYTLLGFFTAYLSVTNIFLIHRDIKAYQTGEYPYYQKQNDFAAASWLQDNVNSESIFLSGRKMGNIIPGFGGRKVYIGNEDQTINAFLKFGIAYKSLLSLAKATDPLLSLIRQEHITHILVDEEINSLGGVDLTGRQYLYLVYENPDVKIYAIQN